VKAQLKSIWVSKMDFLQGITEEHPAAACIGPINAVTPRHKARAKALPAWLTMIAF
jgi:hypothetical protein